MADGHMQPMRLIMTISCVTVVCGSVKNTVLIVGYLYVCMVKSIGTF